MLRHPKVAAKRPSKGDGNNYDPKSKVRFRLAVHPSRLASLAPQDDGPRVARLTWYAALARARGRCHLSMERLLPETPDARHIGQQAGQSDRSRFAKAVRRHC